MRTPRTTTQHSRRGHHALQSIAEASGCTGLQQVSLLPDTADEPTCTAIERDMDVTFR